MDIRVIYSSKDPVGITIKKLGYKFEEINEDVTNFKYDKGDAIIIFSRHSSKAGVPSITMHYPGNPTEETMGGEPKKLGIAYPKLFSSILREILKININIEKVIEATHHGPTYQSKPIIFVEIGSSIEYWTNEELVKTVVEHAIKGVELLDNNICKDYISGFGGPHYSKLFTNLSDENCIGHIVSKHYVNMIDDNVIAQVIKNSIEPIRKVILDSLNATQRERITKVLKNFDINIELR